MHDVKNTEGYFDPTAFLALSFLEREEQRLRQLKRALNEVCALSGYRIKGPVVFENKETCETWRVK